MRDEHEVLSKLMAKKEKAEVLSEDEIEDLQESLMDICAKRRKM